MNQDRFTKEELLKARERNNKSRKYKNDTIWESNNHGSFIMLGRFDKNRLYIQFINTGAIYVRSSTAIATRQVKDLYAVSVCNKGFIGEGKYNAVSHKDIYHRWVGMLQRVYGGRQQSYNDCSISKDWHNFQNFARDIESIIKEKGIDSLKGYEIDKDIKSNGVKIYSKETVSLVTPTENMKEMNSRIHSTVYIAKNLITGEKLEFSNQLEFAREHGLNVTSINNVLKNRSKTAGDFVLYKKGDREPDIYPYIAENIETGEKIEFANQSKFAREHNLNRNNILSVLNGKLKTTGGWKFRRKAEQIANGIYNYIKEVELQSR